MRVAIEQGLGGPATHDPVGDLVGVALERIAMLPDVAREAHPAALLDHVRGLVRGEAQIRRARERDPIARRVGGGVHPGGGGGRGSTDVSAHPGHVVVTERLLDRLDVRQRAAGTADTRFGELMDPTGLVAIRRGRRLLPSGPQPASVRLPGVMSTSTPSRPE